MDVFSPASNLRYHHLSPVQVSLHIFWPVPGKSPISLVPSCAHTQRNVTTGQLTKSKPTCLAKVWEYFLRHGALLFPFLLFLFDSCSVWCCWLRHSIACLSMVCRRVCYGPLALAFDIQPPSTTQVRRRSPVPSVRGWLVVVVLPVDSRHLGQP